MKLRNRFFLVGFGVLVFIIATPVLVLFTGGYKIDWQNHKIVKTGIFVIKTLPTKADIYINNSQIRGQTPETVRFLLPGDYDVRLQKDGYQSWTKRLHIQAQIATWANLDRDFIALFLADTSKQKSIPESFASISQTGDEIAYVEDGALSIYNVATQTTQDQGDITNLSFPLTFSGELAWSNGTKLSQYFRQQNLTLPFAVEQISEVLSDGTNLAFIADSKLYNLQNNSLQLLDADVRGAFMDGETLWYVNGSLLKQYNFRTGTNNTQYSTLPQSAKAQIIRGEGNTFLILDRSLYTLNDSLEKIYDGVDSAVYDTASHKLLFSNQNEILLYNPGTKSTELILRSISPVAHPIMNSYTGYVFFENENKIKAIELDGRDHRNIYTLAELPSADFNLASTSDGSVITAFNNSEIDSYKVR